MKFFFGRLLRWGGLPLPLGDLLRNLAEVSLSLFLDSLNLGANHATNNGRHSLVGEVSTSRNLLDEVSDGIQSTLNHALIDGISHTCVGYLLGSGFLLSRVLLGKQFFLIRDNHIHLEWFVA